MCSKLNIYQDRLGKNIGNVEGGIHFLQGLLPIDPSSPVEFWNLHKATMEALPEDFEVIGADDLARLSKEASRLSRSTKTDDVLAVGTSAATAPGKHVFFSGTAEMHSNPLAPACASGVALAQRQRGLALQFPRRPTRLAAVCPRRCNLLTDTVPHPLGGAVSPCCSATVRRRGATGVFLFLHVSVRAFVAGYLLCA